MLYRLNRKGEKISQLGFGCMRLPKKGSGIDYEKSEELILHAIDEGVNYFDTAYVYSGSEECLGTILQKNNVRQKINIATKLPQYLMHSIEQIEKTFNEELSRLKTDYIDYYLMHMFTDFAEWEKLKALGIEKWFADKKAEGKIRNIGFSYHGDSEMFTKVLNAYDWDFCQIQYNYLDENSQAGRSGLMAAAEKGLPVIIMEPLRGGKLVNLPEKAMNLLKKNSSYTSAELGLKWLWNQKEICCVLSGMNSMEMVNENIRIAGSAGTDSFTEKDFQLVEEVKKIIREKEKIGCTGCRYCMPCPKGVDIPGNFYYWNLMYMENSKGAGRFSFGQNMGLRLEPGFATQCVQCGKCEKHCPQHLPIREALKKADRDLRPLPFKIVINVARRIMFGKKKLSAKK